MGVTRTKVTATGVGSVAIPTTSKETARRIAAKEEAIGAEAEETDGVVVREAEVPDRGEASIQWGQLMSLTRAR